jgi:hypothetical protein
MQLISPIFSPDSTSIRADHVRPRSVEPCSEWRKIVARSAAEVARARAADPVGGRHAADPAVSPRFAAAVHKSAATRAFCNGGQRGSSPPPRIKDSKPEALLARASAEDPVGGRHAPDPAISRPLAAAVHKSDATSCALLGRSAWIFVGESPAQRELRLPPWRPRVNVGGHTFPNFIMIFGNVGGPTFRHSLGPACTVSASSSTSPLWTIAM